MAITVAMQLVVTLSRARAATVAVIVAVVLVAPKWNRDSVGLASASALPLAEVAGLSEALHMMVVTGLLEAHFLFEPQNLGSVLAQ